MMIRAWVLASLWSGLEFTSAQEKDEQAIRELERRYAAAWMKMDEEGVMALFESEAMIVPASIGPQKRARGHSCFLVPQRLIRDRYSPIRQSSAQRGRRRRPGPGNTKNISVVVVYEGFVAHEARPDRIRADDLSPPTERAVENLATIVDRRVDRGQIILIKEETHV